MLVLVTSSGPVEIMPAFSREEENLLEEFVAEYDRLAGTKAALRPPRFMAIRDAGGQTEIEFSPRPSDDELVVLLHRLRPFILEQEPFSFSRSMAVLGKHLSAAPLRSVLREEGRRYKAQVWQDELRITSGQTTLNAEEILTKWLNAYEYHRDLDKRIELEELLATTVPGLVFWVVIKMLFEKIQAITNITKLIRAVIGRDPELPFRIGTHDYVLKSE